MVAMTLKRWIEDIEPMLMLDIFSTMDASL